MAQQQRRTLKPAGEVAGSRGLIERLIPPQPVPSTSKQQELSGNPLRSPLLSVLPASSPSPCSRCLGCHRLPRVRAQCIGTVASRRSAVCIGYPPSRAPPSTTNKTKACSLPAGAAWRTCSHPTRSQAVPSTALTQARNPSSCSESASTQASGAEGRTHQEEGRAWPVREFFPSCVFGRQ